MKINTTGPPAPPALLSRMPLSHCLLDSHLNRPDDPQQAQTRIQDPHAHCTCLAHHQDWTTPPNPGHHGGEVSTAVRGPSSPLLHSHPSSSPGAIACPASLSCICALLSHLASPAHPHPRPLPPGQPQVPLCTVLYHPLSLVAHMVFENTGLIKALFAENL